MYLREREKVMKYFKIIHNGELDVVDYILSLVYHTASRLRALSDLLLWWLALQCCRACCCAQPSMKTSTKTSKTYPIRVLLIYTIDVHE